MARTGSFGGFEFDEEVFTGMMQEEDYFSTPVIESGIIHEDPSIMNAIGAEGNVATIPFYVPLNVYDEGMAALNNDGLTNNTPVEISGGKQTCMLIQRMKAFKAKDFTAELTGADPLGNVKAKTAGYYRQVWEREMMNISKAVLAVSALSSHVVDLTSASTTTIGSTTMIDAEQAALGDRAGDLGLVVMHSMIYAAYLKMELIDFDKYTAKDALGREIKLPSIGGKLVKVTDYNTSETVSNSTVYNTYLFGEGAFLSADKKNYKNQYTTNYDPETSAGVEKFYTKQGKVLHPNGVSLAVDNISKESPTFAELGTSSNWTLKFNPKNVKMGVIKSLG